MAFRIAFVVCSVIAVAHAGMTWAGFDENGRAVSGIYPGVSTNNQPPRMPQMPSFPQFLPLPGFPNFPNFPQIHMPVFHFPEIHIPSPDEIVNAKPQPGQTFHGISVTSDDRGTRVVTNKDGKVHEFEVGASGEKEEENKNNNEAPPKQKFTGKHLHKTPKMSKHEFHKFEMPKMKPIKVLTPEEIKNRKPGDDEHFVGFAKSSFSSSSTINGKTSSAGGSESVVNDNGKVQEESVRVGQEDKEE